MKPTNRHPDKPAKESNWLAKNWLAVAALLVASGSLLVSWLSYREAHREPLLLHVTRAPDYATVLVPSSFPPAGSVDIMTDWAVLIVNNSPQTVSVLMLEIRLLNRQGEIFFYSGLVDAILDDHLRPMSPPWALDPGKPINLIARLRLHVDPSAAVYLQKAYPDGHIASVQAAEMLLADQKLDFWGDSLAPFRHDSKVFGFSVEDSSHQPRINFSVETARGTAVNAVALWFPAH
jgi:hypothetical protein